jgi:deoxyuridine 5'-triphosphate nucleotidohydrolase
MSTLRVKRLRDDAVLPKRNSKKAAGYDIAAVEPTVVPARGRVLVSTGLSIAVPDGTYGRVAPRSGLTLKQGLDVGAGVVDADYR